MVKINFGTVLEPGSRGEQSRRERRVRARFWETMRRAARYIPFAEDVVAAYFCALDPRTPFRVRGILLAALAYFVLPFDAIPDWLAGIGFTDDAAVLMAAFTAVRSHITLAHRAAAHAALSEFGDPTGESRQN
jgi:uncharacterized membrane protein YkvA (DUF1232 family)